jgi:hypothetical protein|tara:strand:- start:138 stop:317 length:180 start_codon:yes stop_codon:yes gene_type:complete
MFTAFLIIIALELDEYYCRLSWFKEGMCIYQCQNGYEQFTWTEKESEDGCKLMKRIYKT